MSATINEICKSLSKYNPRISIQKNITISNHYYLHKDFNDFNANCLYVCKSSQLPENINHDNIVNLLIIVDIPLPSYLNWWDKYNLILLENKKCSIYTILEKLQDFINRDSSLNHFTKKLIEGISNNLSLDEIIKIAFNYLENPIIITNSSQYICAYYNGEIHMDEPLWESYINFGYPHVSYWKNLYYDLNFRESISFFNEPIIVDYYDIMNHRMLISSIKKESFHMAHIYVLEVNKPFCKIDMEILNILNKILLPLINRDNRFLLSNNSNFDPLFYYLINYDNFDDEYVDSFIKIFNMDLKSNLYLIYMEGLENTSSFQKTKYLNDMLKRIFHNHYIYFYNNDIYILFNDNKDLKSDDLRLLSNLLKENNLKCGFSQNFSHLSELKNASYQSKKSILIGNTLDPDKYIYYFSDYIINNLIFTFINHYNLGDLVDVSFMNFMDNNEEDFVKTLKVYCINDGDMQKTSNELHIHYNTLKYRLQKIKDLYYFNIFDYNFIAQLKLSFLALDFLESK